MKGEIESIGTMTEERKPTNRNIFKRWWKRAKESDRVYMTGWIVWALLMLFFAATMVQADTVNAYSSVSDCDADLTARYVATHQDEWALIADTIDNYTFYSLGGDKRYRVTADHRATLTGALRVEVIESTRVYREAPKWSAPGMVDTVGPQNEASSKTSGLTPPRWLCRRFRL